MLSLGIQWSMLAVKPHIPCAVSWQGMRVASPDKRKDSFHKDGDRRRKSDETSRYKKENVNVNVQCQISTVEFFGDNYRFVISI